MGMWYIFMTISLLAGMLELGFSQSLSRSYAYVLGGATKLQKNGLSPGEVSIDVNGDLLASVHFSSKKIYLAIANGGLLLLVLPGSAYIFYVNRSQIPITELFISWLIFSAAVYIGLLSKHFVPLMQGSGKFADFYKSNAISNILFILITAIVLMFRAGLAGIAVAFFVSALIRFLLSHLYSRKYEFHAHINSATVEKTDIYNILHILWPNAWRQGLVVIGAFLILRANTILSSIYLGLEDTATYALSLQMFSVIQSISLTIFNIRQPEISTLIMNDQLKKLRHLVNRSLACVTILFFIGFLSAIFIAPDLIILIKSDTRILPVDMLLVMGLMIFLEMLHTIAASIITSSNEVPFVKPAIFSGVAICLSTIMCFEFISLTIWWLILTQFFIQLTYNNWKWPLWVYKKYYTKRYEISGS